MELWLFSAYAVGTVIGVYMGYNLGLRTGAGVTIEMLISSKYLRSRTNEAGEVELLKPED